jgi:hypothetical protein
MTYHSEGGEYHAEDDTYVAQRLSLNSFALIRERLEESRRLKRTVDRRLVSWEAALRIKKARGDSPEW